MKAFLALGILLVLAPATASSGAPQEAAVPEVAGVEASLGEDERWIGGDLSLDGSYDSQGAIRRLIEKLLSAVKQRLHEEAATLTGLMALALIMAVGEGFCDGKTGRRMLAIAGTGAVAVLILGDMKGVFRQSLEAIQQLSDYSLAAIPAIYTAAAASGAVVSAPVKYAAASFCMNTLIDLSQTLIVPMIQAFAALSLCLALTDAPILGAVCRVIRWTANTLMSLATMAFTAYLSLSGLIAGSTDAAAVKTAKTVLSTALPVVGGILSDSAGVVLSAAAIIRNSAGAFALIAVCALCLGPFAILLVKMLLFRAASAATEQILEGRISRFLGNMGGAMAMLLGVLGSCGLMLLISIAAGIRTVAG